MKQTDDHEKDARQKAYQDIHELFKQHYLARERWLARQATAVLHDIQQQVMADVLHEAQQKAASKKQGEESA